MTQVKLIEAAKAVIARWDTPRWKDAKHTADYIYSLRDAVNAAELASQAQPTPSQSIDERVEFESEIKKYTVCSQSTFKLSGYTDKKVAFYDNQYTQYAWFGWQARANLSKPQADQAATIAHLQLENAKFRDVLEFYKCFSDSRISSIAQIALLNITTAEEVTHNKPDEYYMVLRREDGLHITLDIVNLTITKSGVKRFTLVLGETK